MRGKLLISHLEKHAKRITPADAGKTAAERGGKGYNEDHPRGCGENFNNRYGVYEGLLFNNNPFAAGGATVKRCGVFL